LEHYVAPADADARGYTGKTTWWIGERLGKPEMANDIHRLPSDLLPTVHRQKEGI